MQNYFNDFIIELQNRNYAKNSIKVYSNKLKRFLEYTSKTNFLPEERIKKFVYSFYGTESKRHAYMSIKLFYKLVLKKECPYHLDKVKKRKRLPTVLTREEALRIINSISNKTHKLIISMLYGSGLRVSEVTKILITDVDLDNLILFVRNSKGKKDRYTIISEKIVYDLNQIIKSRGPNEFLFKTINKQRYSVRTIQAVFKNALKKSSINKNAVCHSLRHSFATHLLNNGIDIRRIMNLLGHKSIKTTMIYLHLADIKKENIKSPL